MLTLKVTLTLQEELLGTSSANADVYREFIESKRPVDKEVDEDETASLPTVEDEMAKGTTVFMRTPDGAPFIYDYQVKGFLKDACGMLRRVKGTQSAKMTAYKKIIDGLIFVEPRRIMAKLPKSGAIGECVRPLRAQTAQGERVSLARSETLPVGTVLEFDINLFDEDHEDAVLEWLEYGKWRGLGQWRNSGKGRIKFEVA